MRLSDFESLVRRLSGEVPPEFFEGVAEVVVSPKTVPHPTRGEIYTLGECIPLPAQGGAADEVQSRIVLYHGSFQALARLSDDFDWREEAWQTLTHELRHHLEWRARREELEAFDRAAEENFARHAGEPFDPLFFLDGDAPVEGVYQVDDDYFLDHVVRHPPPDIVFTWHGRQYRVAPPEGMTLPAYLMVEGVEEPPPGDLVLVYRTPPRITELFRPRELFQATAAASLISG
ncbi:MAG: metallopeptidase family protein [Gemmatimonadota bacterium]